MSNICFSSKFLVQIVNFWIEGIEVPDLFKSMWHFPCEVKPWRKYMWLKLPTSDPDPHSHDKWSWVFMVSEKVQTRCPSLPHLLGAWGWLPGPALWPRPRWDPSLTMSLSKDGPTSKLILTCILHENYLLYFQCLWIQSVWLVSRWLSLREWRRERSSEETAWGMCA